MVLYKNELVWCFSTVKLFYRIDKLKMCLSLKDISIKGLNSPKNFSLEVNHLL